MHLTAIKIRFIIIVDRICYVVFTNWPTFFFNTSRHSGRSLHRTLKNKATQPRHEFGPDVTFEIQKNVNNYRNIDTG